MAGRPQSSASLALSGKGKKTSAPVQSGTGDRPVERLERLQRLAAALSRALTVDQVCDAVVSTALEELRADAALVALIAGDGASFEIVRAVGYLPETVEQWRSFPLDAPLPAGDAVRRGEMVVLESLEDRDARYPALRGAPAAHEAFAIVPMIADGVPLGIVSFGFAEPHPLGDDDRTFLRSVTDQCAQAIHRAHQYERQRVAAERQAFLARASRRLARSLEVDDVATELARLVVPEVADACLVRVLDNGNLRVAGLAHTSAERERALWELTRQRSYTRNSRSTTVAETGQPLVRTVVTQAERASLAADAEQAQLLETVGFTSVATVPLQARGRTVGALTVGMSGSRRSIGDADLPFLLDLAAYAALALDNAQLFEERSRIARTLQMSLLPPQLPRIPGMELGASYLAAGSGTEVGGDFYDVFQADADRWIVVIGDVRGRGTDAAATTGLARHTIRAVGFGPAPPVQVVRHLNRVLLDWHRERDEEFEPRFCAVNVVALEPSTGRITVCCAGNPLPLIVRRDGTTEQAGRAGTVAGVVDDPEVTEVTAQLEAGDALVSFTDGISERRNGGCYFEDELASLASRLAGRSAPHLAETLSRAAQRFCAGAMEDDMAVIAVRAASRG